MEEIGKLIPQAEQIVKDSMTLTSEAQSTVMNNRPPIIDGLPKRFQGKGFKNFETNGNQSLADKVQKCKDFTYDKLGKRSLILCGNVGNGKSHLAAAILQNLPPKQTYINDGKGNLIPNSLTGRTGKFLIADEFFAELNDAVSQRRSKLDIINQYLNFNDLVCLDDLGVDNLSEAKRENLYLFVNRAYLEDKRIMITTNITMEELEKADQRIASRLNEMATIIAFTFNDYRMRKEA